jgi:hypothetical protein
VVCEEAANFITKGQMFRSEAQVHDIARGGLTAFNMGVSARRSMITSISPVILLFI